MVDIFDIGVIGTGIATLINIFKNGRTEKSQALFLVFFFFIILKLIYGGK